ncbi:hypothetical protein Tco_0058718 [Tanacetum coccineum]
MGMSSSSRLGFVFLALDWSSLIKRLFSAVEVTATGYEVTTANMKVTTAGYVSTAGEDCRKYSKSLLLLE